MSITISISPWLPDASDMQRATEPRQAGFVCCVVGVAWGRDIAGTDAEAMQADAERRQMQAADIEPQVYCLRHGTEHERSCAPCSDIGCTGCTR